MSVFLILTSLSFIDFSSDKKAYYQILCINLNLYNNAFTGKDYNYYNGKYLNKEDKETFLKLIPKEGLKLSGEAFLSFLSISYNFWNFSGSFNLRTKGKIEKEIFELLLFGNKLNQIYQLKESKGELFTFSQFKNTFNFYFKRNWQLGLGISYLKGHYYFKTENNYLTLLTTQNFLNLYNEINYQRSLGGQGFGFDIGFGKRVKENLVFKIIMENLGNKIFWQKENKIGKIILIIDSLNFSKINAGNYYSFMKEEKETIGFVNNPLPMKINLFLENKIKDYLKIKPSISWAINEFFKFSFESYYQPFNFLWIINSLNLYLLSSKNTSLENFSSEIGIGLGITIKRFDFLVFQEYYKGFLLNAKGFYFKLSFGYNFSINS